MSRLQAVPRYCSPGYSQSLRMASRGQKRQVIDQARVNYASVLGTSEGQVTQETNVMASKKGERE